MQNFESFGLQQGLLNNLSKLGYVTPTPIQIAAVPVALEGKDIMGTAQTGTGKTAAFGIPALSYLLTNKQGDALIMAPTRELAAQVMDGLQKMLGQSREIKTALLIGGESIGKQFRQLEQRPRLIVGTPGRINDHLQRGSIKLNNAKFLVLDETDRMLDLGFGVQIDEILTYLPKERQTLLFSATLPSNILKLSHKYLTNPVRISVGSTTAPAAKIKQDTIKLSESDKYKQLLAQLQEREGSIIVFVKTKVGAEKMAEKLRALDHKVDAIHGDLKQSHREKVIRKFRNRQSRIMVATDVAARGLDIPHIEHVINYDLPQCPQDYIHRIGRTARAGAQGAAVNLVTPQDARKWFDICRLISPNDKAAYEEQNSRPVNRNKRKSSGFGGGNNGQKRDFKGQKKNFNNYKKKKPFSKAVA